ncbi:TPA: ribosomal-protein-alanine N-acetyltransferase [Candidatus Acetothermia bacterium]|nr:ribosomal-protein-alanine N-acetyltransferase [Candidatus Acetothermia bacterium]
MPSPEVTIRRAAPADLPWLAAIETASFRQPWPEDFLEAYLADRESMFLVAEVPKLAGFLIAREERYADGRRAFHVHDIAVAPAERRRGVASVLLAELIRIALAQGVSLLRLEVRRTNYGARAFYEHHGFREIGRVPRFYEDGGDAIRMERTLASG